MVYSVQYTAHCQFAISLPIVSASANDHQTQSTMRLHLAALMAAATLMSTANAISTPTYDGKSAVVVDTNHDNTASTRLLRTVEAENEDEDDASDEDRMYIPGLETVSNYVWSWAGSAVPAKTLEGWLQNGKSADEVFQLLKLDKAGDSLLSSPKLESWLAYAKAFNLKSPQNEASMITTFRAAYGDAELAKIIKTAKGVPNTEKTAKELQVAQFNLWMREGMKPEDVYSKVFKLTTDWQNDPAMPILRLYNRFFKEQ